MFEKLWFSSFGWLILVKNKLIEKSKLDKVVIEKLVCLLNGWLFKWIFLVVNKKIRIMKLKM